MKPIEPIPNHLLDTVERALLPRDIRPARRRRPSAHPMAPTRTTGLRALSDREQLPEPGTRIDRYELIRLIGIGGMGSVHLARDLRFGRLVAIKFLTRRSTRVDARFEIEAQATARCQHSNIVVIHDMGEHDDRLYLVLEYIAGQNLREWLEIRSGIQPGGAHFDTRLTPVPAHRVLEIMVPVVRALHHAHDMGIVHRDLKPANIMLTERGTVKVLDFGIAKLRATYTEQGSSLDNFAPNLADPTMIGTLAYMSPEQLDGGDIDHQSDLWALGIILHEMLTGRHPLPSLQPDQLFGLTELDDPLASLRDSHPQFGALAEIIDRCLIKRKEHRIADAQALLDQLEALLPHQPQRSLPDAGNPFAGLAPFEERDADRFFGREREIAELRIQLASQPMLVVAGASGAGKSSLVRAGLIPALKRSGAGWRVHIIRPGRSPLGALADALDAILETSPDTDSVGFWLSGDGPVMAQEELMTTEPGFLGARLRSWANRKKMRLLLFIDQFEELMTLCIDPYEINAFLSCIDSAADDPSSPLRIVVAVRSDFLDRLAGYEAFSTRINRNLFFLPPPTPDGVRAALEKPLAARAHRFEDQELLDEMVAQVSASPAALPLLQFAAHKMWEQRDLHNHTLTWKSYRDMGGLEGTLAAHADTVVASLDADNRRLTRVLFQRLVTPDLTRALVSLSELRALDGTQDVDALVHYLADMRLLVLERDEQTDSTVELVHESLITTWPRLAGWLAENQGDMKLLGRVRTAAREWHDSGRPPGLLWRDQAAQQAYLWRERYSGALTDQEKSFLEAVFDLTVYTARRKRRWLFAGVTLLLALLCAATIAVVLQRTTNDIERQKRKLQEQASQLQRQAEALEKQKTIVEESLQETRKALASAEVARDQARRARDLEANARQQSDTQRRAAERARDAARIAEIKARNAERRARASESKARAAEARAIEQKEKAEQAIRERERSEELLREERLRRLGPLRDNLK